jgi:hypothetical protein
MLLVFGAPGEGVGAANAAETEATMTMDFRMEECISGDMRMTLLEVRMR